MGYVSVVKPGMLTTIQDLGRYSYRNVGVSTCGVMDRLSFILANILVGNERNAAGLEVTLIGPKLEFNSDGVIAITGGNLSPSVNGIPISMYTSIQICKGDVLSFGKYQSGARAYIAFAGGICVPKVMGSRSTYLRGKYGGFDGRAIQRGDKIPVGESVYDYRVLKGRKIRTQDIPEFKKNYVIRFIMGPHHKEFTEESFEQFLTTEYTVTNDSDRMGYRLEGSKLNHLTGPDIISDFVTPGTIQVPGSGQPIIHMADCGTSGGYTKIGVVIGVDMPYVAQKKPGDTIQFQPFKIEQAQTEWRKQEEFINELFRANYFLPIK